MEKQLGRFTSLVGLLLTLATQGVAKAEGPKTTPVLKNGEFTTELKGLKLWYKVSGRGPACLMPCPAWGPSSDLYFRTLKPLERHFTVVYLDSRGTGRSQRANSTKKYTWDHLVADLDDLRAHLKQDKVWLMGHSEGGMQILHYACKHPERVSGLVLLATAAACDKQYVEDVQRRTQLRKNEPWFADAQEGLQLVMKGEIKSDDDMKRQLDRAVPLYFSDPRQIPRFRADFDATSMSLEALKGSIACRDNPFDLTGQIKRIKAPTLIVAGGDDFICSPAAAQRMHLALPTSKFLLIEKAGHFPWLEQPKASFGDVAAFLEVLGVGSQAK